LAVWAIILNVNMQLNNVDPPGKQMFGFNELPHINDNYNFDHGALSDDNGGLKLTPEEQRMILRLLYFKYTTRCATPRVTEFLNELFSEYGLVTVIDNLDMTMTIVFDFDVPRRWYILFFQYDPFPRPAGVRLHLIDNSTKYFGFDESNKNFDNGSLALGW
jgi:hypothetical protein